MCYSPQDHVPGRRRTEERRSGGVGDGSELGEYRYPALYFFRICTVLSLSVQVDIYRYIYRWSITLLLIDIIVMFFFTSKNDMIWSSKRDSKYISRREII